jgi:pyruvate,orthophosphate dikinase
MERYNAVLADIRKMTGHAVVWTEQDFETMCREFKAIQTPPDDVWVQLRLVLCKLYSSWFSDQAVAYRVALGFPKELGTAAIVQQYIAGDHGYLSTRSTSGDSQDIQGCLVKGATERRVDLSEVPGTKMRAQLLNAKAELEWMFKDMQDVEFAVDPADEVIHVTQSKPGHRNAKANLKIAVSMASERVITERQAVMQVDPLKLEHYLRDHIEIEDFRTSGEHVVIARGTVGASAGCVSGVACFSSAACLTIEDCNLILITDDCVLDDVPAIKAATAIITKCGSPSCEAAVLCRGLGKPCLVLASPLVFDYDREGKICGAICGKHRVNEGDILFVDSDAGELYIGYSHPGFASNDPDLAAVLGWADKSRRVLILGDAESCAESTFGLNCGSQGVGKLDLTFNTSVVLEYLVSRSAADKQEKLRCLENYLKAQYAKILRGYHKKRVTVRLFDGSMSDFLPSSEEEAALGTYTNISIIRFVYSATHS